MISMETIAGFPFFPLEFTREGRVYDEAQVGDLLANLGNTSDLLVISHGWNNDMAEARTLYSTFLRNARALLDDRHPAAAGRTFAVAGVFWPSKRFTDKELIPGGGAASLGGGPAEVVELQDRLEELKGGFDAPGGDALLTEAKALAPQLETSQQARERYGEIMKALAPAPEATLEGADVDAHADLQTWAGDELIEELAQPLLDRRPEAGGGDDDEGGAAFLGMPAAAGGGGAAGVVQVVGGIVDGARQATNLVTYYQMKNRAGVVGTRGLAPVLARVRHAAPSLKLQLAGHSFGARLVTAATAGASGDAALPVASLSLLQAAFSHFGFAQDHDGRGNDGFFRHVVKSARVSGPVVISHTRNDKAVGIAYALASRLAGQRAAAIGDENDPFGGLGSNGAQKTPERVTGLMQREGGSYTFEPRKVYNLRADAHVSGHGDVANPAVVNAVLHAIAST
ncbi:MAG: hypothetical protein KY444_03950 [Gemmatimonadetes bacterium]|nr:hypothetical protein [Gemmatimonadota bacterium]